MSITESGLQIFSGIASSLECDEFLDLFSRAALSRGRAGARGLMAHPTAAALARDSRMVAIASSVLGRAAVAFRATLFEKSSSANWLIPWHQDTALPLETRFDAPGWGPWSEKAGVPHAHAPASALERVVALRLHLDESGPENGPLRVIPRSHLLGVLTDDEVHSLVSNHAATDALAPRGGVIAMRPLVIHSSRKTTSSEPRRVLHIEYSDSLELAPGVRLAIA